MYFYLDQNVLSDLRPRKLEGITNSYFLRLRMIFNEKIIRHIYSDANLDEINAISNPEYQNEHIRLLVDLGSVYVHPCTKKLDYSSPEQIWGLYVDNKRVNLNQGITQVEGTCDKIHRKLSGLPVAQGFDSLDDDLRCDVKSMLENSKDLLININPDSLDAGTLESYVKTKKNLDEAMDKVENMPIFNPTNCDVLGPKPFRAYVMEKYGDLRLLPSHDVIPSLIRLFSEANGEFRWDDHFGVTTDSKISGCYTLMNWAGYYADDFDEVKKAKDRFKASNNDLIHTIMATPSNFFLTCEKNLLAKAKVCYSYLGLPVQVVTPEQLMEGDWHLDDE